MPLFHANDKRIYFFHVPKAGGTSVENSIRRHAAIRYFGRTKPSIHEGLPLQHMTVKQASQLIPELGQIEKFALVRHPLDRLISEFKYRKNCTPSNYGIGKFLILNRIKSMYKSNIYSNHIIAQSNFVNASTAVFKLEEQGVKKAISHGFHVLDISVENYTGESWDNKGRIDDFKPNIFIRTISYLFYYKDYRKFNYSI